MIKVKFSETVGRICLSEFNPDGKFLRDLAEIWLRSDYRSIFISGQANYFDSLKTKESFSVIPSERDFATKHSRFQSYLSPIPVSGPQGRDDMVEFDNECKVVKWYSNIDVHFSSNYHQVVDSVKFAEKSEVSPLNIENAVRYFNLAVSLCNKLLTVSTPLIKLV